MKRLFLLGLLLLCSGCTLLRVPVRDDKYITHFRCLQKVYISITDPDTGRVLLIYTNDGGSTVVKSVASGVETLAPLLLAEPPEVK